MIHPLPPTVGFARVSQTTKDQGNLETQTRQLQEYGVHEVVTEIGSGARSDRQALKGPCAGRRHPCRQCHRPHQPEGRGRPSLHQGCDGAGVHLVVLSQREFDTTTPTDQLLLHLTLAIRRVGVEQHPGAQHPGPAAGPGRGEADRETPGAHCRGTAGGGAQAPRGESVNRIAQVHRVHHSVVPRVARELEAGYHVETIDG